MAVPQNAGAEQPVATPGFSTRRCGGGVGEPRPGVERSGARAGEQWREGRGRGLISREVDT